MTLGPELPHNPLCIGGVHRLLNYVYLAKPRSVLLLVVAALASFVACNPHAVALPVLVATLAGGAMASGGANALNSYLDRDLDARMGRTSRRPLPLGLVTPRRALSFGLALSALSILLLAGGANLLSAALAGAGIIYYVVVYTMWLKRRTSWNVVVGGLAGVMPVLVGGAAATGGLSWLAIALAVIVFLWTPVHFWSLALLRRDEYAHSGIPVLPVVAGAEATRQQVLGYAIGTVLLSAVVAIAGMADWLYAAVAIVAGCGLLGAVGALATRRTDRAAWVTYKLSSWYLACVLSGVALDRLGLGSALITILAGTAP